MSVKLMDKTPEANAAELKILEKDDLIKCLSEQLESKFPRSCLTLLLNRSCCVCSLHLVNPLETRAELEQSWMAWEQVAVELEQAKNSRRESETSHKASILDHAKLG
jgi:hypothetical protein